MRALWSVAIMIGCSRPAPVPDREPTPQAEPVVDAAPPPVDAAKPIDAAMPDALLPVTKRVVDEVEGFGTCKADADCALSSWQPGCCTGSCGSYSISATELAQREKKANCPKVRTKPCPPPAPCPLPTHRAFEAFCHAGACWARRNVLSP